ncbi:MAG: arylesterase, partial [Smithellaceae bacterium]|nr:arylesterase [Smithellaceae bacterium]
SACFVDCSSPPKLSLLAANDVIVAFGDSLTFGTGVEQIYSYPTVLGQMIGRKVVNAGVPGEVTADGLSRLPKVLQQKKPALLILCHGANDQLRRLNLRKAAGNIKKMISLARHEGVSVVLIAVPAPNLSVSPHAMYGEIAWELSVPLEEKILSEVLADSKLKSDFIHPNATGYRLMAEAIAALLKKSGAIN